jgi:hypothetical protein
MEPILAWILAFMVSVAPPGRKTFYAEAQETKAEAEARYRDIAEDIVDVVYDPNTKVMFRGSNGRSRTVSIILSIMLHESGFMKNVDFGVGKYARGDQGKSWCLMQLNVGAGRTIKWNTKHDRPPRWGDDPADIFEGHKGEELVNNRKLCIQEGLKVLRVSFSSCRGKGLPLNQRLRVYASGSCERGAQGSAGRMNTAIRWFQNTRDKRRLFKDSEVMQLVEARLQSEQAAAKVAADSKPDDKRTAQTPVPTP